MNDEEQSTSITWKVVAGALAIMLLGMVGYMGAAVWTTTYEDHGRILLLEKQAVLNRNDIDKITGTLDRITATLQQMGYEHQKILDQERRQRP